MVSQPLAPGARVGRYEVVAHLATGGMGEVYRARDLELGRDVALKVLSAHLVERPAAVERFRREARAAARLSHKHIVTLFDFGHDGDAWYLAMEFVDGIDLHKHIVASGRLDPDEAYGITVQAARALDHAFRQGITHRDIKPSNFLLTREGRRVRVKLTDLGLARAAGDEEVRVTRDGTTVGTVDYLAPEQARDSSLADVRSDIYALGCTLYHMLAGQAPFASGGLGERIYKHMEVEPTDVRRFSPDVPAALWAVLKRMLAKAPEDRYQTPAELLEALLRLNAAQAPAPLGLSGDEPGASAPAGDETDERTPAPPTETLQVTSAEVPGVRPEHRLAAATQFRRAREILSGGEPEKRHAYDLLVGCCSLDPSNTLYRQELRRVAARVRRRQGLATWLASPGARARLVRATQDGDHRQVLEYGEAVLAHAPEDVATHLAMAEAAAALKWPSLQIWLLEQACRQDSANAEPLRRLALAYEGQKDLLKAATAWQAVRTLCPDDREARRQLVALMRQLARGYERQNQPDKAAVAWQAVLRLRPKDAEAARQISALARGGAGTADPPAV